MRQVVSSSHTVKMPVLALVRIAHLPPSLREEARSRNNALSDRRLWQLWFFFLDVFAETGSAIGAHDVFE